MLSIIISGMPAVGKTTAANLLAQELGLKVIGGGDILKEMARDRGYDPKDETWWDTDEGISFLREREVNPEFDKEADRRLLQKIKQGNVIVTSYTAPWISKVGFKVWLDGSLEKRTERMAKRDNISLEECRAKIIVRDKENYELYKRHYGIEFGTDKKPFDMVINTDNLTARQVADAILEKMKETGIW
ncbi:MAG: (d)CMP kinase [Candidatus Micrarchaeia archaeon]